MGGAGALTGGPSAPGIPGRPGLPRGPWNKPDTREQTCWGLPHCPPSPRAPKLLFNCSAQKYLLKRTLRGTCSRWLPSSQDHRPLPFAAPRACRIRSGSRITHQVKTGARLKQPPPETTPWRKLGWSPLRGCVPWSPSPARAPTPVLSPALGVPGINSGLLNAAKMKRKHHQKEMPS